jgi:hypothetical protein
MCARILVGLVHLRLSALNQQQSLHTCICENKLLTRLSTENWWGREGHYIILVMTQYTGTNYMLSNDAYKGY